MGDVLAHQHGLMSILRLDRIINIRCRDLTASKVWLMDIDI